MPAMTLSNDAPGGAASMGTLPSLGAASATVGVSPAAAYGLGGGVGTARGTPLVRPWIGQSVWLKRYWSDDWEYIPYLRADLVREQVAPGVSEATFDYDYGVIKREDVNWWAWWAPLRANGAYVRVLGHTPWDAALLFCGVIDDETFHIDGTHFPSGTQPMTAYGLEHLLDRKELHGSHTVDGWIQRPITFNEHLGRGEKIFGNRAADSQLFGGTDKWSHLDIAEYALERYAPGGISWRIVGERGTLDQMFAKHSFEGSSIWDTLNELVDRRRGLAMRTLTSGAGPVYLQVFSILPFDVRLGNYRLPGNPNQVYVRFDGLKDTTPRVHVTGTSRYERVRAKGGPVTVCFSISDTVGTMIPGWTEDEAAAYLAGDTTEGATAEAHDLERGTDKHMRVYQYFVVPDDWNGRAGNPTDLDEQIYPVTPEMPWTGVPDFTTLAPYHMPGKTFLNELPLLAAGGEEYREPFVLARVNDGERQLYAYVHRLGKLQMSEADVQMHDQRLALWVRPPVNHIAAQGVFDAEDEGTAPTENPPEWHYTTYIATVAMETDTHLEVRLHVPPATETGREKLIQCPELRSWYVVPGTVLDVDSGELVRQPLDGTTDLRVQHEELQAIAVFAASWYGYQRATLEYEIAGSISLAHAPGTMVLGVGNGWHYSDVGTVVTERVHDLRENTTLVRTSFREIDAPALRRVHGKARTKR